jgi:hypothetical protein
MVAAVSVLDISGQLSLLQIHKELLRISTMKGILRFRTNDCTN